MFPVEVVLGMQVVLQVLLGPPLGGKVQQAIQTQHLQGAAAVAAHGRRREQPARGAGRRTLLHEVRIRSLRQQHHHGVRGRGFMIQLLLLPLMVVVKVVVEELHALGLPGLRLRGHARRVLPGAGGSGEKHAVVSRARRLWQRGLARGAAHAATSAAQHQVWRHASMLLMVPQAERAEATGAAADASQKLLPGQGPRIPEGKQGATRG